MIVMMTRWKFRSTPPPGPSKAQQPLEGQGLLIIGAWRSLSSDTPHSVVGLLCTSDQSEAETSTWQHSTRERDIHAAGGIRTRIPNKRAAVNPLLRLRGHWDRPKGRINQVKLNYKVLG